MSKGVNKVLLIGNIGRVEIKDTKYGQVVNFSLATSYKSKEKEDVVEWHNCCAFNQTAEIAAKYLATGLKLYVEGSIKTDKWQNQSGENRYSTKIIVRDFQILTPKGDGDKQSKPEAGDYEKTKDGNNAPVPNAFEGEESAFPDDYESVPF